jgi:hypothetical protein
VTDLFSGFSDAEIPENKSVTDPDFLGSRGEPGAL